MKSPAPNGSLHTFCDKRSHNMKGGRSVACVARPKWGTSKGSRKHEDPGRHQEGPGMSPGALKMEFTASSVCWVPRVLDPGTPSALKSIRSQVHPSRECLRLLILSCICCSCCFYCPSQSIIHQLGMGGGTRNSQRGRKSKKRRKEGVGTGQAGASAWLVGFRVGSGSLAGEAGEIKEEANSATRMCPQPKQNQQ